MYPIKFYTVFPTCFPTAVGCLQVAVCAFCGFLCAWRMAATSATATAASTVPGCCSGSRRRRHPSRFGRRPPRRHQGRAGRSCWWWVVSWWCCKRKKRKFGLDFLGGVSRDWVFGRYIEIIVLELIKKILGYKGMGETSVFVSCPGGNIRKCDVFGGGLKHYVDCDWWSLWWKLNLGMLVPRK